MIVEYKGFYVPLEAVPSELVSEWETTLKGERARILNALLEKIPNATAFLNRLAVPAHERWLAFLNPQWPDSFIIALKHSIKLKGAYASWNDGVQNAFKEGGTFETNVGAKKDKLQKLRYVVGGTGIKYKTAWGPAYKAIGVISGDTRVTTYMGANDTFTGAVANVFLPGATKYARAIAVPAITQGLVIAQYAHEAGLTPERNYVLTIVNGKLLNTVLRMVDTDRFNVTLNLGFDENANKLYVYTKAETV